MALIKGKQLKDASLDIDKLAGIASDVAANKLLLTAADQSTQALTLDGDLSQAISGSTYSLTIDNGAVVFDKLNSAVKVTNITPQSVSDTTFATSNAVKSYVDSQITTSGSAVNIAGDTGTDSVTFTSDTLSFVGGSNLTTTITDNQVSTALDSHISIASATLSGSLLVGGNLTVQGTTTTVNSTEVEVADAHLRLGAGTSTAATLITAAAGLILGEDAAGISLRLDAQGDFASTQSVDLATGKVFKINNVEVLSADGASKVQSAVAGDGLTHTSGVLSSNGLAITKYDVLSTISNSIITSEPASYVGSLELKVNGISQIQDTDWEVSAGDINWISSDFDLESGDVVTILYHAG